MIAEANKMNVLCVLDSLRNRPSSSCLVYNTRSVGPCNLFRFGCFVNVLLWFLTIYRAIFLLSVWIVELVLVFADTCRPTEHSRKCSALCLRNVPPSCSEKRFFCVRGYLNSMMFYKYKFEARARDGMCARSQRRDVCEKPHVLLVIGLGLEDLRWRRLDTIIP